MKYSRPYSTLTLHLYSLNIVQILLLLILLHYYNYLEQLQNRLGPKFINWIEQESSLHFLQKTAPQKGVWTDVVWGMPNMAYYEAKAAVAKNWGINYQTQFMGNERTPALVQQQREIIQQNAAYFAALHQHFPATWIEAFHREVQQAYQKKLHQ